MRSPSLGEIKLFQVFFLWVQGPVSGIAGPINYIEKDERQ